MDLLLTSLPFFFLISCYFFRISPRGAYRAQYFFPDTSQAPAWHAPSGDRGIVILTRHQDHRHRGGPGEGRRKYGTRFRICTNASYNSMSIWDIQKPYVRISFAGRHRETNWDSEILTSSWDIKKTLFSTRANFPEKWLEFKLRDFLKLYKLYI